MILLPALWFCLFQSTFRNPHTKPFPLAPARGTLTGRRTYRLKAMWEFESEVGIGVKTITIAMVVFSAKKRTETKGNLTNKYVQRPGKTGPLYIHSDVT